MPNLFVPKVRSRAFVHMSKEKRLCAEISSLGFDRFMRLAEESPDVGFTLISDVTGNESDWRVTNVIRDLRENETQGWYLEPTAESVAKCPTLAGYSMVIDND